MRASLHGRRKFRLPSRETRARCPILRKVGVQVKIRIRVRVSSGVERNFISVTFKFYPTSHIRVS